MQSKQISELFVHEINDLLTKNIPFHFLNFEYSARTCKNTYPIEMGLVTYQMNKFELLGEFHQLIYCYLTPHIKSDDMKHHHGLDIQSPFLRKDYKNIVSELRTYLQSFNHLSNGYTKCKICFK